MTNEHVYIYISLERKQWAPLRFWPLHNHVSFFPLSNPFLIMFAFGSTLRTYQLRLHGGTPFESGVPLDVAHESIISHRSSRIFSKPSALAQPHITVRLSNLKKEPAQLCDYLPATVLTNLSAVSLIAIYRETLVDVLLKDRRQQVREG